MKRKITAAALALSLSVPSLGISVLAAPATPEDGLAMRRLYNPNSGEHFYTSEVREFTSLIDSGWLDEGYSWFSPAHSDTPVYRLYNKNAGDHHYTSNRTEKDYLVSIGWTDEGIGWYSMPQGQGVPVYREYNPNATTGSHNYTPDYNEHMQLGALGWKLEDVGWYAMEQTSDLVLANQKESMLEASQLSDYVLPKNILRKCNQVTNSLSGYRVHITGADEDYTTTFALENNQLYEASQFPQDGSVRLSTGRINSIRYPFSDAMFSIEQAWTTMISPSGQIESLNSPQQNAGLVGYANPIYLPGWVFKDSTRWSIESRSDSQAVILAKASFPNQMVRSTTLRITINGSFQIQMIEQTDQLRSGQTELKRFEFDGFNQTLLNIPEIADYFEKARNGQVQPGQSVQDPSFMFAE